MYSRVERSIPVAREKLRAVRRGGRHSRLEFVMRDAGGKAAQHKP